MKKIIAVAALVAAGFAAPTMTTTAQAASAYPANCLVLPLLQAECRTIWSERAGAVAQAAAKASATAVADVKRPKVPYAAWWTCEKAPEGTKAILTCSY